MIFFFQAEDGIRDLTVTGVQTCALPISSVFFLNTQLIQQYWATNTPSGRVTVLDVDSSGGAYADIKDAFRAAKDLIALDAIRSEEHTSELQSQSNLVCRPLLEKKKKIPTPKRTPHD